MEKLIPGKLPPGSDRQIDMTLASLRAAIATGVDVRVTISPGPGCPVSEALAAFSWPIDEQPALPIPGCVRSPCCGCCYVPWFAPSESITPEQRAQTDREFEVLMASLPPEEAVKFRQILASVLAGFGIAL